MNLLVPQARLRYSTVRESDSSGFCAPFSCLSAFSHALRSWRNPHTERLIPLTDPPRQHGVGDLGWLSRPLPKERVRVSSLAGTYLQDHLPIPSYYTSSSFLSFRRANPPSFPFSIAPGTLWLCW